MLNFYLIKYDNLRKFLLHQAEYRGKRSGTFFAKAANWLWTSAGNRMNENVTAEFGRRRFCKSNPSDRNLSIVSPERISIGPVIDLYPLECRNLGSYRVNRNRLRFFEVNEFVAMF